MRSRGGYRDADLQKGIGQCIGQRGLGDHITKLHAQMHHRQGNLWTNAADNTLCAHQFRGQNRIKQMLGNMASITRVLGANVVVVGMQPAVAITIVELGLSLMNIHTALNVDKGMALLRALVNKSTNEGPHEPFEK